jgi:hypothetical protein
LGSGRTPALSFQVVKPFQPARPRPWWGFGAGGVEAATKDPHLWMYHRRAGTGRDAKKSQGDGHARRADRPCWLTSSLDLIPPKCRSRSKYVPRRSGVTAGDLIPDRQGRRAGRLRRWSLCRSKWSGTTLVDSGPEVLSTPATSPRGARQKTGSAATRRGCVLDRVTHHADVPDLERQGWARRRPLAAAIHDERWQTL